MAEVAEAVRTAAAHIRVRLTAEPLAAIGGRAAKIRRTRRAMMALGAAGCLVALGVGVSLAVVPGGPAERVVTAIPPTTSIARTQAPGSALGSPTGSRTVTYRGVQIVVPTAWPVLAGSKAPVCNGKWPTVATVYVGPQNDGAGCGGGPAVGTPSGRLDGVALQASNGPVTGTVTVTLPSGQQAQETPPVSEGPGATLLFHGIWVQIGADTPTVTARNVLASLAYQPAAPDTAVVDACTTIPASDVMPTPIRLNHRMVLDRSDYVLDPLHATDQPSVPASVIWSAAKPSPGTQTADSEQLLLTLLTAKFPATLQPDGHTVPDDQNLLAWVIYSAPLNTSVPNCGEWGINVFNAKTGAQLISSGWTPGP